MISISISMYMKVLKELVFRVRSLKYEEVSSSIDVEIVTSPGINIPVDEIYVKELTMATSHISKHSLMIGRNYFNNVFTMGNLSPVTIPY